MPRPSMRSPIGGSTNGDFPLTQGRPARFFLVRSFAVRVAIEILLLALGVVIGSRIAWIVIGITSIFLTGSALHWYLNREKKYSGAATSKLVEAEIVLAREEAAHAKVLLAHADPVTAAMIKAVWPDWRAKIAAYVSLAISQGAGMRFNPVGREETVMALGESVSANLNIEADIELLDHLMNEFRLDVIETDQEALEEAARARRENEAASLFRNSDPPGGRKRAERIAREQPNAGLALLRV
jgi:hypothetical protein